MYDFLFTWIDALARSSAFLPDYESTWPFTEEPFIESREPVSWKTPSHFWHCPDCGQRGEED